MTEAEGSGALLQVSDLRVGFGPRRGVRPVVNGVRLGLGVAVIGTLLAETKLSNQGVGFLIINSYSTFNMPRMYALLLVLFAIAIGVIGV